MKQEASLPCPRFGLFEANLQTGELRKEGLKIRLGRHALKLLILLLERPGQLRTRDEIRQRLWGNDVFVNFEQSLNKAVHQLRDALGDNASNPHYIETVPERGYRFIYFAHATNQPARKHVLHSGRTAVLPFATEPATREMELLNKILIGTLIDKISLIPGLRVLAYSTVQCYRNHELDPQTAGRNLLASTVLVGDITQSDDQLMLHVELIDVRDGTQRWGGQFRQSLADAQSDPGALADRIYAELASVLVHVRRNRGTRHTTHRRSSLVSIEPCPAELNGQETHFHLGIEED